MTSDGASRWEAIKALFHAALEQPATGRAEWLTRACGDDALLLTEATKLLRAHDTVGDFLETSAVVDLADLLEDASGNPAGDPANDPVAGAATVADESVGIADQVPRWTPGSRVGPYVIVDEIGRGGMGVVFLAEDERLGRRVALKALPPAIARRSDLRERLRREARVAATIAHRAVATVYALEEIDDHLLLASAYIQGPTLRQVVDRGPVDATRARLIATSVAGALAAAHAAGVVHRDLKPENIVVGHDGSATVVDFGIALIEGDDRPRLTGTNHALGTPAYMAPEQLLGLAVDARADIWAFGVVLREMLLGHHPLAEGTHVHGVAARLGHADSPHRAALLTIADRCTHTVPDARYASAAALLADLERDVPSDGRPDTRDALLAVEALASGALASEASASGSPASRAPASGLLTSGAPAARSAWWWEFHQGVAGLAYVAILVVAWRARAQIGGLAGRSVFALATAAAIVAVFGRWHLWFTSRFYQAELAWVRARAARFVRAADWIFVVALAAGSLLVGERSALDVALLACATGAAVAFLVIEPVTARAAFGREASRPEP